THRRVKRQVWRDRWKILRVERQNMLQAFDAVGHQQSNRAENQHRYGVLLPIMVLFWINAAKLVEQPLDRSEEARQRLPVPHEYPLQTITCPDVNRRNYKEDYGNENKHKISHINAPYDRFALAQALCRRYRIEMLVFLKRTLASALQIAKWQGFPACRLQAGD